MLPYDNHLDNINDAIHRIEASGNALLIDQAAFLLGMFKDSPWVAEKTADCPKISALLPEMSVESNPFLRMMQVANWMDRDDDLGYLADQMRKWLRP